MNCSICNAQTRQWAPQCWGNNADPYPGRCCDDCNQAYVIPARLALIRQGEFRTEKVSEELYEQIRKQNPN
jgi:hypothetical protein